MKRLFLVMGALVLVSVILLFILERLAASNVSASEASSYVQGVVHSMTLDKGTSYEITSVQEAVNSPMSGKVWCITIQPPMRTSELASVRHLLAIYYGSLWSGSLFEDSQTQQARWLNAGCQQW